MLHAEIAKSWGRDPADGQELRCTRCNEKLNKARTVWLELNCMTGQYVADEGAIPEAESQGWFPFGSACAKRQLQDSAKCPAK